MMAEESRGKRRKQANPRRNQVDIEQASSLGSEGKDDDKVGLWSLEVQDYQDSLDKTSLTPSEGEGDGEGTEPAGSPSPRGLSTRPHNLSLSPRPRGGHWAEGAEEEESPGSGLTMEDKDGEREQGSLKTYTGHRSDSQALEDMAHYDFLVQLRKASSHHPASHHYHQHHQPPNGSATAPAMYHPGSLNLHDDPLPIWSPGTQRSPEGQDGIPLSPDAIRNLQACPFCQRTYHLGVSLREHIKFCHERDRGHMVCPVCGYTPRYRAQMEQHMALHSQVEDKHPGSDHGIESRKFKCLQCGKAFKYKHHLKEHLRIHSGEKPYECSNCKKRFSHSGSYSSHLSSKKCLTGGGGGSGGGGGGEGSYNNGHGHHGAYYSSLASPSAGSGRNSSRMGSPYLPHTQEERPPMGLERNMYLPRDHGTRLLRGQELGWELGRRWDPTPERFLRASVFKESTLLPYLHAGTGEKFEQMLQAMLHREEGGSGSAREEGRLGVHNGGRNGKASPEALLKLKGDRAGSGDGQGVSGGVTCRWCSQLFPSPAILLQHERYLCKIYREAMEVSEDPHSKKHLSPLYISTRPPLHPPPSPDNHKPPAMTNGFPKDKSPLQRPSWNSVPQQLLVAMHSPFPPSPDSLAMRSHLSSQESGRSDGSPGQPAPTSPATDMSSPPPLGRRRVPSSGFGSHLCLDLSSAILNTPASRAAPQGRTHRSYSSENDQPLDLSLPKPQEGKAIEDSKPYNGHPHWEEKRQKTQRDQAENQHHRRLSINLSPPPHQHHAVYSGAHIVGGSIYSAYPLFNPMIPAGLAGSEHDGVPSLPLSRPVSNQGFLSPMTYMMESDTDAVLKRIHQERRALMGEVIGRGGLDYLSLIQEGGEGEGGPGRKRLQKTDEGLYACDICDKTFQKSSSLLRHKYEHTGKRPHECKICKKAFKHKHHLIEHSRLHSGEKPYQCDKCGKRFSHSGSYSQHMNHRYAYCSLHQDQEGGEELPLTPGGPIDVGHMAVDTPLSMEDTPTFLSDSSLDGGIEGRVDEEEEEEEHETEETEGGRMKEACSLSGSRSGEGLGPSPSLVQGSPVGRDREREQRERDKEQVDRHNEERESAGLGTHGLETSHHWDKDTLERNGDQNTDTYELSPEAPVSQQWTSVPKQCIKTCTNKD
ncbi:zinc finger E-box-binding homeobox 1-like [Oncorhynchus nerka]|uniref:zinc finger E-box-binding homeobox 1-like n=1 Tax=Oncorhynchus nerka TaxID=8023 RepID=UPI0011310D9A|nr:zinc finger E-box-binding homeobox 1-like [Oncorhynchus nerka]